MASQPPRGPIIKPYDPEAVRLRALLADLIRDHDLNFNDVGSGSGADPWTVSRFMHGRAVSTRTIRQLQSYVDSRTLGTGYHKQATAPAIPTYPDATPKLDVREKYRRRTRGRLGLLKETHKTGAGVAKALGIPKHHVTGILAGNGVLWPTLRAIMVALDAYDSKNAVKSTDAATVPIVDVVGDVSLGEDPHPAPPPVEQRPGGLYRTPEGAISNKPDPGNVPLADLRDDFPDDDPDVAPTTDVELDALAAVNNELTLLVDAQGKDAVYRVLDYCAKRYLDGGVMRPQTFSEVVARTFWRPSSG